MNPRDYQSLAERLTSGPSPAPAECRAAVSRAYYAAFNVAADWLRSVGFAIGRGAGAHGEVRHCLANAGDRDVADAATALADLHGVRNRCDYHLARADVERAPDARYNVKRAAGVIQTRDRAFSGPAAPQLRDAVQTWRRANGYP